VSSGAETGTDTGSHARCDKWCTESSPFTDKINVKSSHPPVISIMQSGPQASCILEIWSGRWPSHGHHQRQPAGVLDVLHDFEFYLT
jgi:hypothetical protein